MSRRVAKAKPPPSEMLRTSERLVLNRCRDCDAILLTAGAERCKSCSRMGDKNGLWKGDAATPNIKRRRAIRWYSLDGVECETPECRGLAKNRHHIDGDVGNNARVNIALLCTSCHAKIHGVNKRGERHGRARFTNTQAAMIRERYLAGGVPQDRLAREYGVGQMTISNLVRGVSYAT